MDYNVPLGPMQVISRRTDRMIREKQQILSESTSIRVQPQSQNVKSIQLPNSLPPVSPVSARSAPTTQHRIIMSSPSPSIVQVTINYPFKL